MKYNQIKTKEHLTEWIIKKKSKLNEDLINFIDNFHKELNKIEEKANKKLRGNLK